MPRMPRFPLLKPGERAEAPEGREAFPLTPWCCPRCHRRCFALSVCRDTEIMPGRSWITIPIEDHALRCTICGFSMGFTTREYHRESKDQGYWDLGFLRYIIRGLRDGEIEIPAEDFFAFPSTFTAIFDSGKPGMGRGRRPATKRPLSRSGIADLMKAYERMQASRGARLSPRARKT